MLRPGGRILSLLKPQYEADRSEMERGRGRVKEDALPAICERVREDALATGLPVAGPARTPFLGGKGKNPEFFMLLGPTPA